MKQVQSEPARALMECGGGGGGGGGCLWGVEVELK